MPPGVGSLRNSLRVFTVHRDHAAATVRHSIGYADARRPREGLVFGVANRRSIAWAIAQALAREGAELAFTFQGERIEQGVRDLAATVNSPLVLPCDVTRDDDLDRVFDAVSRRWGGLDILVHSVAYAPPQTFERPFAEPNGPTFRPRSTSAPIR